MWRIVLLSAISVLALSYGVARASVPKLVLNGHFGAENGPLGVAVNQTTGNVYVAGFINLTTFELGHIDQFDAAGNPLSPSFFGEETPFFGAAVNPTNGDVNVVDVNNNLIATYAPGASTPSSSFTIPLLPEVFGASPVAVQIATDAAGHIYVPDPLESKVLEYEPNGTELQSFTDSGALKGPSGVAVDQSGNVWIADAGNNRIVELDPTGAFVAEIKSEGVQSLALGAHGEIFALVSNGATPCGSLTPPCTHLMDYGPTGAQLADVGAGDFGESGALLPFSSMLAVDQSSGRVYVTDLEKNLVWVFAPPPPVPPKIESEVAVEVGPSDAKLGANVNPGGVDATYRFEYGATAAYGHRVPVPDGDAGTGFQSRSVWTGSSGLQPGATYHYRVVVTSEFGEVFGDDKTFTTETAMQARCPNDSLRNGFAADLPDCRAYELVTPPNKSDAEPDPVSTPEPPGGVVSEKVYAADVAASDGDRLAYQAEDVLPGSRSAGRPYVATRGQRGWSSVDVIPPQNYYGYKCPESNGGIAAYAFDLSIGVLSTGGNRECGGPESELVSGEPRGVNNLYVSGASEAGYMLINVTPVGVVPTDATFVAASADLRHVVFRERARLTPNALNGVENLYEWSAGVVRLLALLPNGTPVSGTFIGISADGSHVFFRAGGNLYARVNGAETVQIDASQTGGGGGGGSSVAVSGDGSRVLFTDANKLTVDSTAQAGEPDLYRFDFHSPEGERLTDLTVNGAEAANVQGVVGVGQDGSNVYFTAKGVLAVNANTGKETAVAGQINLYLNRDGVTTFIATFASGALLGTTQASASGTFLVLDSTKSLTGYENTDTNSGKPDSEVYLYDSVRNALACASCNPSGEPPARNGAALEPRPENIRQPRYVSEGGRVFFETREALLPSDTNGQNDVYEFESDGTGSCSGVGGCLFLISTGTSSLETGFIDASASGDDVFLREYQKLVPQDTQEEARTIYDARVDGGFPEPAQPPPCAATDECRTAPASQPSVFGTPNSQTFSGGGNVAPPSEVKPKPRPRSVKCKRGFVKRKGKCVRKHATQAKKSAHINKRTGR